MTRRYIPLTALATLALSALLNTAQAQRIYSGVGPANVTASLNAFRAALGNDNGNVAAPQNGGRREINWDAVKLDGTDFNGQTQVISLNRTVGIPVNRFQTRGMLFEEVYAVSGDGFASVNPATAGQFPAFSPKNTFAMFDENTLEMSMILPSAPTAPRQRAGSRGFGAIFVGVQLPYTTSIEYFNGSTSLGKYFVNPGTPGQAEFLGVVFDGNVVTDVEITLGSKTLFFVQNHQPVPGGPKNLLHGKDIAVVDDFVYGEPGTAIAAAQPASVSILPAFVHGGANTVGKVTMNRVAAVNTTVSLSILSGNAAIGSMPAQVVIPAGSNSANFAMHTNHVLAAKIVKIQASANGKSKTGQLIVNP